MTGSVVVSTSQTDFHQMTLFSGGGWVVKIWGAAENDFGNLTQGVTRVVTNIDRSQKAVSWRL